jgi:hypothetical protein
MAVPIQRVKAHCPGFLQVIVLRLTLFELMMSIYTVKMSPNLILRVPLAVRIT